MLDTTNLRGFLVHRSIPFLAILLAMVFGALLPLAVGHLSLSAGVLIAMISAIAWLPLLIFSDGRWMLVVWFLTLAYPYRFSIELGPLNSVSVFEMALVLGFANLLWQNLSGRRGHTQLFQIDTKRLRFSALDVVVLSYVGFSALSLLWAESRQLAIRGIIPIVENVALYYAIIAYSRVESNIRVLTRMFLLLGTIAILLSLLFNFAGMSFLTLETSPSDVTSLMTIQSRAGSPAWGRSNYFASILMLFLPAYFSISILSTAKWKRLWYGVVGMTGLIVTLLTWSRGGWISMAVALVVLLFLLLYRRQLGLRSMISILVLTVTLGVAIQAAWSYVSATYPAVSAGKDRLFVLDDDNTLSRLDAWGHSTRFGQENALGLGIGNSSLLEQTGLDNVHNAYLQSLVQVGWIGFGIFIALLGLMLRENWRLNRNAKGTPYDALAVGLLAGFVSVLVNVAGESSFDGVVFGWIFWSTQALVRTLNQHVAQPAQS